MDNVLLIIAAVPIFINILVSIFLYRRDDLEQFQKVAQTIVVWLVPFVGAFGLWQFHRSQDVKSKSSYKRAFGGGSVDSAGSGD